MAEYFTCEQFVAGALLRFDSIDNIDISILLQDIKEKFGMQISGSWNIRFKNNDLNSIVEYERDNVSISLSKYKNRKDISREFLEKKLKIEAGEKLVDYFMSLDIDEYQIKKNNMIQAYNSEELLGARVLLLSESSDDYGILVNMGFKRINWLKSIKRANDYFDTKPNILGKHDIIIIGRSVLNEQKSIMIDKIRNLNKRNRLSVITINREGDLKVWITDRITGRRKLMSKKKSNVIPNAIRECTLTNRLLETKTIFEDFEKIPEYVNHNKIPLPKKRSDIKILWLLNAGKNYRNDVSKWGKSLGLNITVERDKEDALEKIVESHLGEYDIILASSEYSPHLTEMVNESNEQCKDTGRNKVLLATYYCSPYCYFCTTGYFEREDVTSIQLSYRYYGSNRVDINYGKVHNSTEDVQKDNIKTILSGLIEVYNEMLKKCSRPVEPIDFPNITYLEREYNLYCGYIEITMFLQNILRENRLNEVIIALPHEYYLCKQSDGVLISGIYDGERRTLPIYIEEDGKYSTLKHPNKKMADLFISEVSDIIKKEEQEKIRQKSILLDEKN